MPLTILIIENFYFLRSALRRQVEILFPTAHIIEADSQVEAITLAGIHFPQVIVVDIGLTGSDGLKGVKDLKDIVPVAIVVVLTSYEDETHWDDASAAGAAACVAKAAIRTKFPMILTRLLACE